MFIERGASEHDALRQEGHVFLDVWPSRFTWPS